MKAIAIARVSSLEQQTDGQSLDAQQQRLLRYIRDKNLELIHEPYQITESSTQGARKKFMAILEESLQKNETLVIVVDKVDRFQRTFKETVYCEGLRVQDKIQLHFVNDNLIINKDSSSSDIMRWNFCVMMAQSFVLAISDNVKRTNEYKLSVGQAIGPLPPGYLNIQEDNGTGKKVGKGIIDPSKAYLIKKLFELYSTATYSYRSLAKKMRELGLTTNTGKPVSQRTIEDIIHNPIYYGEQLIKNKLHPHMFGNIISKDLFDRCQEIIDGKRSSQTRPNNNRNYLFRGFIRCGHCGRLCTSYKGKLQNYVMCTQPREKCPDMNIAERELINQLEDIFKNLIIPKEIMEELISDIKNIHEGKIRFETEQRDKSQNLIKKYSEMLDNLLDMKIDPSQSITQEQYDKKANELRAKISKQQEILDRFLIANKKFADLMIALLTITTRSWQIFQGSSLDQKRQLLGLITLNLTLKDKKLVIELQKPFDAIYNANKTGKWGRLESIIINLEPNQISLIERIVSVLNLNMNSISN